jgi:hypothetical protein
MGSGMSAVFCPGAALDILPSEDGALINQTLKSPPILYSSGGSITVVAPAKVVSPALFVCQPASAGGACTAAPASLPLQAGVLVRLGMQFPDPEGLGLSEATLVDPASS